MTHTRFRFGENWRAYADTIEETAIAEAVNGLRRLVGESIAGKRFLDIGCGSGVHALAALRLGATEVMGVDLDSDSVAAARIVLSRYAPDRPWRIEEKSILDLTPAQVGCFDIVYSWGVLHHTGNMLLAICKAADLVAPHGLLVCALYRRTWLDPVWRLEKRWYARASDGQQQCVRRLYIALFSLGLRFTGRKLAEYTAGYHTRRGMNFYHDVHDWLGGWPYESISAGEVDMKMQSLGFQLVRSYVTRRGLARGLTAFFGSGCDEYVYRRT